MRFKVCAVVWLFVLLWSCTVSEFTGTAPKMTVVEPFGMIDFPLVELIEAKGTREELLRLTIAVHKLNLVYSSQCFEGETTSRTYSDIGDMNGQEVFNTIRQGPRKIKVIFYTGSFAENYIFRTVGFIRDSIPDTVFQNRFFVSTSDDMARNLIHEVAHLWGFRHVTNYAESVPYQMNDIWDVCKPD